MTTFPDPPCMSCQHGYNRVHTCDVPDWCPCDRSDNHIPAPKPIVVSGNRITVTRLGPEGQPLGDPIDLSGKVVSVSVPEDGGVDVEVVDPILPFGRYSMDVTFKTVNPEVLALLFGFKFKPRPWWWRFTPKRLKQRLKRREIRRGYGG